MNTENNTIRPNMIALIAYDNFYADLGLQKIYKEHSGEITRFVRRKTHGYIIFNDGTMITAFSAKDTFRGRLFDQIILCDDDRNGLATYRAAEIEMIKVEALRHSCVPKDYQVLHYDLS